MVFSLFAKSIHEPVAKQIEDLKSEPIGPLALSGEDCDQIGGASGPLGHSYNNPIPVNGLLGTYKYFCKLITPSNDVVYFHRLGSLESDKTNSPVDAYEIVDRAGRFWDILFLDMYHPRRSNKCPAGYSLKPYDSTVGDIPFAFGVDIFCTHFPHDLADAIEGHNGLAAFARRVRESVGPLTHQRPHDQELKLIGIRTRLTGTQVWGA